MFAEIHHKAPVSEDVLTSSVFGVYRHLPVCYGLGPFLEHIREDEPMMAFADWPLQEAKSADFHFWPRMNDGTEPDVVVILKGAQGQVTGAICVEAKLGAAMSYYPSTVDQNGDPVEIADAGHDDDSRSRLSTQLANEMKNMLTANASILRERTFPRVALVYLTHHITKPVRILKAVEEETQRYIEEADKRAQSIPWQLVWASWYDVYGAARRTLGRLDASCHQAIRSLLESLCELLKRLHFIRFEGWPDCLDCFPGASWGYSPMSFDGWENVSGSLPHVEWPYPLRGASSEDGGM